MSTSPQQSQEQLQKIRQLQAHIDVVGRASSPSESDAKPRGDSANREENLSEKARNIALRQLSAGPKTRHQLAQKMGSKEVPQKVIDEVLDRFEDVKLIDDEEFARHWVGSRHRSKGLSRAGLRRELKNKGIDQDKAERALEEINSSDEWSRAVELVERRATRYASYDLSDRRERDKILRRLVGMLARKGYAPGMAFSVANQVLDSL